MDEGDHVYTLKWYQGIDEFYRWTPLETPEIKTFPIEHFTVDPRASRRGHVFIQNVTVNAGGSYRCEVSGEAPYFKTSFGTGYMTVVDLPDSVPSINTKDREPYKLHQEVDITCTSRDAQPAPTLSFYLNQQPWEGEEQVVVNSSSGLQTAIKTIRIEVLPGLAEEGVLQVKCVAAHPDLYWESNERNFSVDLPEFYHHRPPSSASQGVLPYSGETSSCCCSLVLITLTVFTAGVILR
ncbi:hypothetical protein Pmani_029383 [Petrolisthes manimaculis]|uniref:CD80-like immunoglobulin C2-set domain-containing protein n=1 Tax=Petrolisthes manimaculis TaxID=1843537 RepID=A0AAE1NZH9_9EUCA|nr:hypothetical protein Pmani_029383 [Petrolisthes manimaculis]